MSPCPKLPIRELFSKHLEANGPAFVRCGRYSLLVFPTVDAAEPRPDDRTRVGSGSRIGSTSMRWRPRALRAVIDRILTIAIACRIKQTGALHRLPPEPTTRALDTPESKAGLDKRRGPARARRQLLSLPCPPPTNGPTRRQRLSGPTGSEARKSRAGGRQGVGGRCLARVEGASDARAPRCRSRDGRSRARR